mmetsp:Transcript_129298/g.322301  ORF Transcript_129298/g.322301 Transcript_129298/m.322301 type:complete len:306 (-) Transcript_129298:33-950(-)
MQASGPSSYSRGREQPRTHPPELQGQPRGGDAQLWFSSILPPMWSSCSCGSKQAAAAAREAEQAMAPARPGPAASLYAHEGWQEPSGDDAPPPWVQDFEQRLPDRILRPVAAPGAVGTPGRGPAATPRAAVRETEDVDDEPGIAGEEEPASPPKAIRDWSAANMRGETLARLSEIGVFIGDVGVGKGGEKASEGAPVAPKSSVREASTSLPAASRSGGQEQGNKGRRRDAAREGEPPHETSEDVSHGPSPWPRRVAVASVTVASAGAFAAAAAGAFPVAAAAGSLGFALGILSSVLGIRVGRWVG